MTTQAQDAGQRILVIGASGQVGRELLRSLAGMGEIIATTRTGAPLAGAQACRALDLTEVEATRRLVREVQPTVIVNAAAYTQVDRAETETEQANTINGTIPGVLAAEAAGLDAGLIHYSTDYVFDGSGTRGWREDDPPCPLSAYGRSKLAGEQAVRAAGAAHAILRISWIYAAHGNNFVKTMLRLGGERAELRVVADQIGAPTPASLVAATTARLLSQRGDSPVAYLRDQGGTYHVPCAGETSWHGFAEEVFRLARLAGLAQRVERVVPITTQEYPTPAVRPLNSRLDGTRFAARFGLALPDWRAALAAEFPAIVASVRS